jgi:hypothetical protein
MGRRIPFVRVDGNRVRRATSFLVSSGNDSAFRFLSDSDIDKQIEEEEKKNAWTEQRLRTARTRATAASAITTNTEDPPPSELPPPPFGKASWKSSRKRANNQEVVDQQSPTRKRAKVPSQKRLAKTNLAETRSPTLGNTRKTGKSPPEDAVAKKKPSKVESRKPPSSDRLARKPPPEGAATKTPPTSLSNDKSFFRTPRGEDIRRVVLERAALQLEWYRRPSNASGHHALSSNEDKKVSHRGRLVMAAVTGSILTFGITLWAKGSKHEEVAYQPLQRSQRRGHLAIHSLELVCIVPLRR